MYDTFFINAMCVVCKVLEKYNIPYFRRFRLCRSRSPEDMLTMDGWTELKEISKECTSFSGRCKSCGMVDNY